MSQDKGLDIEAPFGGSRVFFVCLKLPGTAKALILFGFAFEAMTFTREEKARMRGMFLGKKSFGLACLENGDIDNAA
jgi:hypothetical protein